MTLEELWELFPIVLLPHNPLWREWATEEIASLANLLSEYNPLIYHVGSTAIPDIQAKPIVDILVEISETVKLEEVKVLMEENGYICMSESESRISFNKGYTLQGYAKRVFHIHFHRFGDNEEILFRDYLLAHPNDAKMYERLKLSLLPEYRNDRDAYTEAKTDFIKTILDKAKRKALDHAIQ